MTNTRFLFALLFFVSLASATQYQVARDTYYLLQKDDSLVLGTIELKIVEMAPPDAIFVAIFSDGKKVISYANLRTGKYLDLPPYAFELREFVKKDGLDYANMTVDLPEVTPTPRPTPTPADDGNGFEETTPEPTPAENEQPTPLTADAEGYPLAELDPQVDNSPNCLGQPARTAEAIISPKQVSRGQLITLLLQDTATNEPVEKEALRLLYPSGREFLLETNEIGITELITVEKGRYEILPGGCFEMQETVFYAYPAAVPGLARQILPEPALQFIVENYFTLLFAIVVMLLLTVAWFTYDFVNENSTVDQTLEKLEARIEAKVKEAREKIQAKLGRKPPEKK